MTWLLDTNVISEWIKPRPDEGIVAWLNAADERTLYVSVIAVAEIRLGIAMLPRGRRRDRLEAWADRDLVERFRGRILSIDPPIAEVWARLLAKARSSGVSAPVLDTFLAATAVVHGMTLVTRNVRDFVHLEVPVLNPWSSAE